LSRTKALRTGDFENNDGEALLIAVGKLAETLVEKARFDAAARQLCLINAGRTIEAISIRNNSSPDIVQN
jgi:hypothetical protein